MKNESVLETEKESEVMNETKPKNEIAAIRERLQESKGIANAVRGTWKEIANNKRQADEALAKLVTDGFGPPSAKELHDGRVAKWSSMTSYIDSLKKFIETSTEAAETIDELVYHSQVDIVNWADRAVADLMVSMPGFSSPVAKSRVADMPQTQEGHRMIHDTQRQASAVRQLIQDALAAIAAVESEMKTLSIKWRTV